MLGDVLIEDLYRVLEVDRYQLRDAPFGHGDAEQAIHPRHRDRIVGDDDKARLGRRRLLMKKRAGPLHIVVVERGVDFVQHANRRWIGEEHRENQRQCGQRLLSA